VGQASQFLASQIEQLRAEIEERESRLQAYGRSKDIVSMEPQTNITLQKLEAVNRDYSGAVNDRIQKGSTSRQGSLASVLPHVHRRFR